MSRFQDAGRASTLPFATSDGRARDDEEDEVKMLGPSPGTTARDGDIDPIRVDVERVLQVADACGQYRGSVVECLNALEKCRRQLWYAADAFHRGMRQSAQAIEQAEGMKVAGFKTSVIAKTRKGIGHDFKGAEKVGAAAQTAMQALQQRIDIARSKAVGPASLTNQRGIEGLLQSARLEAELESIAARNNTLTPVLELLQEKIRIGDEDAARLIEDAVIPLCTKTLTSSPSKAVGTKSLMGSYQAGDLDRDKTTARRILAIVDQRKAERVPGELLAADQALELLRPIFRSVVGVYPAKYATPAEFHNRFVLGSGSSELLAARSTFEIDSSWPIRMIDQNGRVLVPGWSPPRARDSVGNVVR